MILAMTKCMDEMDEGYLMQKKKKIFHNNPSTKEDKVIKSM